MERELFCVPCDAFYKSRAEHMRLIKPDSWVALNVPVEFDVKPVDKEVKNDGK